MRLRAARDGETLEFEDLPEEVTDTQAETVVEAETHAAPAGDDDLALLGDDDEPPFADGEVEQALIGAIDDAGDSALPETAAADDSAFYLHRRQRSAVGQY